MRLDTSKGQPRRKTFVVLGNEKGGKYRQYKKTYKSLSETRKCECPFRLRGRPLEDYEGWMLKLIYGADNHDLFESLVSHLYVG